MVITEEQLIAEFKGLFQRLAVILDDQKKYLQVLAEINEREKRKEKKEDLPIAKEQVIAANDDWESPDINNPEYNRAKIFLATGFTPAHTGGLTVDLYYQKTFIQTVLKVITSNGSTGGASQVFDIAHLSGFHFVVSNHDSSNSTTISQFKIVMYKEDI